jgi:hypothetical protein
MKLKHNRWFVPLGLLVFFLLSLVPNGQGQATPLSYAAAPAQISLSWTFTASSPATSAFNVAGLRYFQMVFVPVGTVSACGVSFDSSTGSGFTTGGIFSSATIGSCAAAGGYSNSIATTPTQLGQLTPTITGSGSVIVVLLGYVYSPTLSPALDSVSGGTAPTVGRNVGGVYNASAPAPSTGQFEPLQLDAGGNLYVNPSRATAINGCMGNYNFTSTAVNASTTSAVQLVAASAAKKIYVCSFFVIGGGTSPTLSLEYGTGTNCGTGTTLLMGAIPLSTTTPTASPFLVGATPVSNALCYLLAGTSPTAVGVISYVQN